MARAISSVVLAATLLAAGTSCDDGNYAIFVVSNVSPDTQCTFALANPIRLSGQLDVGDYGVGYVPGYSTFPRVRSLLINRAGRQPALRADPDATLVEGAIIRIRDTSGAPITDTNNDGTEDIPAQFSVAAGILVPSGVENAPGEQIGEIEIIPPAVGVALRQLVPRVGDVADVVVRVRPFGRTVGGVGIRAVEWQWPVRICNQCLRQCASTMMAGAMRVCTPGQDGGTIIDPGC